MTNATLNGFRHLAGLNEDLSADQIRRSVMSYMSHSGENRSRLTEEQWAGCYLLADGFGQVDLAFAAEQCWDWSHVRDSSDAAFDRMWQVICHWHNRGQLAPQRG